MRAARQGSFGRVVAALAVIVGLAALGAPSSAGAAGGSQVPIANVNLTCVLAPGVLNVTSTVVADVSLSAPSSVAPGGSIAFTQEQVSLETAESMSIALAGLGASTASGTMPALPVDAPNATPATADLNEPLTFGPTPVTSGTTE